MKNKNSSSKKNVVSFTGYEREQRIQAALHFAVLKFLHPTAPVYDLKIDENSTPEQWAIWHRIEAGEEIPQEELHRVFHLDQK
jgi:hypothetical protein